MKNILILFAAALMAIGAQADEIRLTQGSILKDVTVTRVDQDGIIVTPNRVGGNAVKYTWNQLATEEITRIKAAAKEDTKRAAIKDNAVTLPGKVLSVTKEGILVHYQDATNSFNFFVYTTARQYVDNAPFSETLYMAGRYQYTSLLGANSTVLAFALNPEEAFARMKKAKASAE